MLLPSLCFRAEHPPSAWSTLGFLSDIFPVVAKPRAALLGAAGGNASGEKVLAVGGIFTIVT